MITFTHTEIMVGVTCATALLQISVLSRALITWRRIDHACFVDEMRRARDEKRAIIGWNRDHPVLGEPGSATMFSAN